MLARFLLGSEEQYILDKVLHYMTEAVDNEGSFII